MTTWFSVTEVAARSASNTETDDLRRRPGRLQQAPATSAAGRAGLQRRHRRARLRQALTVSRRGLDVTVSAVPIRATRRPSPGGCVTSTQVGHMWMGEARFVVGRGVCGGLGVSRASARGLGRPGAYRAWAVSRDGRDVGASPRDVQSPLSSRGRRDAVPATSAEPSGSPSHPSARLIACEGARRNSGQVCVDASPQAPADECASYRAPRGPSGPRISDRVPGSASASHSRTHERARVHRGLPPPALRRLRPRRPRPAEP